MRLIDASALNGYKFGLISPYAQNLFHKTINEAPTIDYKRLLEQEFCNDCISRQAAIDAFNAFADEVNQDTDIHEAIEIVLNLPPVIPAEKIGHWEWKQYDIAFPEIGNYHCSSCDAVGKNGDNYCSVCGTKMQEVIEDADSD